jgi:hypothetical protein
MNARTCGLGRRKGTGAAASLRAWHTVAALGFFGCLAALAASGESGVGGNSGAGFPWRTLIPAAVPLLIAVLKGLLPKIPKAALPVMATLIGAMLDIGQSYLSGHAASPILGAALGAAGVGLREIVDQTKKMVAGGNAEAK